MRITKNGSDVASSEPFFISIRLFTLFLPHLLTLQVIGSRLGWERGLAAETGKTPSQENAPKTRRVPQVGCTRC